MDGWKSGRDENLIVRVCEEEKVAVVHGIKIMYNRKQLIAMKGTDDKLWSMEYLQSAGGKSPYEIHSQSNPAEPSGCYAADQYVYCS